MAHADIAVICAASVSLPWEEQEQIKVNTPYGPTSDMVTVGTIHGRDVAFIPRHGSSHTLPPHKVPYQANIWAFKQLGVSRIIALNTVGSLQPNIHPGDFLICDQFVDRTSARKDTFYDGPVVAHISTAYPFCHNMRKLGIDLAKERGIAVHEKGTCVVIQGPRFSTLAESKWFTDMGWGIVNMTLYPECVLAREQEICYLSIALVTDYDSGLIAGGKVEPVTFAEVARVSASNVERSGLLISSIIKQIPIKIKCECESALEGAILG